jgi:hypothetical protein
MKNKMTLSEIRNIAAQYGIDYSRTSKKSIKLDVINGNAWYENNPNWVDFLKKVKKSLVD